MGADRQSGRAPERGRLIAYRLAPSDREQEMDTQGNSVLTAVVCGLVSAIAWVLLTLPANPRVVDRSDPSIGSESVVTGAFHVHTTRSDGGAPVDEVAGAAREAGLQFLIVTDHGDGTRPPQPPQYRSGVLTLDSVEISTSGGHYIAIGLPQTPYPLGGEPDTVVEDVRRLGGFGVIAHPTSPKPDLNWRDPALIVDAVEWLNADSQWRDESSVHLLTSALRYPFRPSATLASLLDRPDDALAVWDRASWNRQTVGLAGHDAHGLIVTGTHEEQPLSLGLTFPDYVHLLRTFSLRVDVGRALTGDPQTDSNLLLDAIRAGRVFTVVDALASPAAFEFEAIAPAQNYSMGERVPTGTAVELRAATVAPPGTEIVLLANGLTVYTVTDSELRYRVEEPAVYRVEVRVSGVAGEPPVPWIVSNPIIVGDSPIVPSAAPRRPTARRGLMGRSTARSEIWSVEHDPNSDAEVTIESRQLSLHYRLSDSATDSPYAVLRRPVSGVELESFDGVAFDVVADRPVRLFVHLRAGALASDHRWRSSFYADTSRRQIRIAFDEFNPVQPDRYGAVDLAATDSLLLGAELVNAKPGSTAVVTIRRLRLERW